MNGNLAENSSVLPNNSYLNMLKTNNPALRQIRIVNGNMTFRGKIGLNMNNFSLQVFVQASEKLGSEINSISAEDFFNIVNLHVKSEQVLTGKVKTEELLETIGELSPSISAPTTVIKNDSRGLPQEYFQVTLEDGRPHIFYGRDSKVVASVFSELTATKGLDISLKDLENALNRKMDAIEMVDSHDVENSVEPYSEDFKLKMATTEAKYDTNIRALGNEEHDIYIDEQNEVVNYQRDEYGTLVQETYANQESDQVLNSDSTSSFIAEANAPGVVISIVRMSSETYYSLLDSGLANASEKTQMQDYESFISELIMYQEYLMPALEKILADFIAKMTSYAPFIDEGTLNESQTNAYNKFQDFLDKKREHQKKNEPMQAVLILEKQKPTDNYNQNNDDIDNNKGYVNPLLAVVTTSILGVVVASIMVILAL